MNVRACSECTTLHAADRPCPSCSGELQAAAAVVLLGGSACAYCGELEPVEFARFSVDNGRMRVICLHCVQARAHDGVATFPLEKPRYG